MLHQSCVRQPYKRNQNNYGLKSSIEVLQQFSAECIAENCHRRGYMNKALWTGGHVREGICDIKYISYAIPQKKNQIIVS